MVSAGRSMAKMQGHMRPNARDLLEGPSTRCGQPAQRAMAAILEALDSSNARLGAADHASPRTPGDPDN
jgi:hypothetical protein